MTFEMLCDWCDEPATHLMRERLSDQDRARGLIVAHTSRACDDHYEEWFVARNQDAQDVRLGIE